MVIDPDVSRDGPGPQLIAKFVELAIALGGPGNGLICCGRVIAVGLPLPIEHDMARKLLVPCHLAVLIHDQSGVLVAKQIRCRSEVSGRPSHHRVSRLRVARSLD